VLAPESHRTTRQPAFNWSTEPAIGATEPHERMRAVRARRAALTVVTFGAHRLGPDGQLWRACPGPNPKVRPTRPVQPELVERGVSFRSRVVRNLLEARHVVLGRRPDEVVLKATPSGTGLVEHRARRGRRMTRVLGPRRPRIRREVLAGLARSPSSTWVRRPEGGSRKPEAQEARNRCPYDDDSFHPNTSATRVCKPTNWRTAEGSGGIALIEGDQGAGPHPKGVSPSGLAPSRGLRWAALPDHARSDLQERAAC
jgi:hypothetical protein